MAQEIEFWYGLPNHDINIHDYNGYIQVDVYEVNPDNSTNMESMKTIFKAKGE